MKSLLFLFFIYILFISCRNESSVNKDNPTKKEYAAQADTIKIINGSFPVEIPVHGFLKAWKTALLAVPQKTRLIALLVEEHSYVKKGDLLASVMGLDRQTEWTPVDLFSPISGQVTALNYKLHQIVPANRTILKIEDLSRFILSVKPEARKIPYIKRDQRVKFLNGEKSVKGHVNYVDREKGIVTIAIDGTNKGLQVDQEISGEIECGIIKGSFLSADYFVSDEKIRVHSPEEIDLTLFRVGFADSLVLVNPPLPEGKYLILNRKIP